MAGIGFELRKILSEKRLFSILKAYGYSAAVSSGPWLISIISILIAGFIAKIYLKDQQIVTQFQVTITYLIAISLIFTSFFQLSFTRYIADRIFEKKINKILPNLLGAIGFNMVFGFFFIFPFALIFINSAGVLYSLLFTFSFTVLCGIWIANVVLSGLKNYKFIILSFFLSYFLILVLVFTFGKLGLNALLASFFAGHAMLFFLLAGLIIKKYPSDKLVEFDFLNGKMFRSLIFTGFFYNAAVWADKFIFWFHPQTSGHVLGFLRDSAIYDLPIFLAYLAIAPGMAVFLLRVETDFAQKYEEYYSAAREGATLAHIYKSGNEMIEAARTALIEIIRIQSIITIMLIIFSEPIFKMLDMPLLYLPLFYIDLVATQLQLFFMSLLAIMFYLDRKRSVFILTFFFLVLNVGLTFLSIELGPYFFGYGFALSLLIVSTAGMYLLNKDFERLHYETFMLQ
ncbi:exopolysaccharide Pel transporter PelG [Nitrosophilus alvini]|uniref:exopolysaccharide Pel transporter PelG n=1 Tax=Nitrosophilus alvini TaxID=2714855 RepID=UPI0019093216|nr:exopolysaccharide Pel transporter PelG [Nitrosophilus alvini]